MAGKRTTVVPGTKYGRLTLIERAGSDKYRHPLVKCLCDCGKETTCLLSKLRSMDPKQWTRSCGCLKSENSLEYWSGQAKHLSADKCAAIFADRCSRISAFQIASRFGVSKYLVDAAVRRRQRELRTHSQVEMIKHATLANMRYEEIAAWTNLKPHEVAWLAKDIRKAHKEELQNRKEDITNAMLAQIAFTEVSIVREEMKEQKRKHFLAREWTESRNRRVAYDREGHKRPNVHFAGSVIELMAALAITPDRKDMLRWFRETIVKTQAHRRSIRRGYATANIVPTHLSPEGDQYCEVP